MDITGRKLFVKAMEHEGVDTIFAYPGGMITDILDELYKSGNIRLVLPRHEQALVHEAEGYARARGRVGVCLVTSGPGATNAITGIADAHYDSIPLVVITGQVAQSLIGNDAFQEVDIVGMTRSVVKWGVTVHDRRQLGKILKMAFQIAASGKPGPVLIDIPKDIQQAYGPDEYPDAVDIRGYKINDTVHIGQLKKAFKLLERAKRPVILAGGGVHIAGAGDKLRAFAEKMRVPVVSTVMGKGTLPAGHELYVGDAGMHGSFASNTALYNCDVLFSIGTRFNDRITGNLKEFVPSAKIVHIDIDTASISRNVVVDVPVVSDASLALDHLLEWAKPLATDSWLEQIRSWDQEHPLQIVRREGKMSPQTIMESINREFTEGIFVADVGQHQMWAYSYIALNEKKRMFTSGGLGTMGFGFPAAIGARIACPDQNVICLTGDGGFQMNMQEMATAVLEDAPVIVCIFNNGYLGMVRQQQEYIYGKRYAIVNLNHRVHADETLADPDGGPYEPDFVRWAKAYGVEAIRVTKEEEILSALKKARQTQEDGKPMVIEFVIAREYNALPMVKGGRPMTDMILK